MRLKKRLTIGSVILLLAVGVLVGVVWPNQSPADPTSASSPRPDTDVSGHDSATQRPADVPDWQTDWQAFVAELTPLLKRNATSAEMSAAFEGKPVVWTGTVKAVHLDGDFPEVHFEMPAAEVPLEMGSMCVIDPILRPSEIRRDHAKAWADVRVGDRVRFRTRLKTRNSRWTTVAVLQSVADRPGDPTKTLVVVSTSGAELLERLGPNVNTPNPGSQRAETAGDDRRDPAEVWRVPTDKTAGCVAYSPDGKTVLANTRLLDADTGKMIREFKLPKLTEDESKLLRSSSLDLSRGLFVKDGKTVVVSDRLGRVVGWDVSSGKELFRLKHEQPGSFHQAHTVLAATPDGKRLVSARAGGVAQLWDTETGRSTGSFTWLEMTGGMFGSPPACVWVSPDGERAAVSGQGETVIWATETGKREREVISYRGTETCTSTAITPDGKLLLQGLANVVALDVWDLGTGKFVRRLSAPEGVKGYTQCVATSADGRLAAIGFTVGNNGARLLCWDVATGKVVGSFQGHARAIAFSPDGKRLLSEGYDGVRLWRLTD